MSEDLIFELAHYVGMERMSLKQMKMQTGFALCAEEYAIAVDAGVKKGMHQLVQFTER